MAYIFSFIDNFGRSGKWSKVRKDHIKQHPKCAACGRTEDLEVHHIVPYQIDPTKELDPENLITLCGKYCHFVFGHLMDWKSWNENVKQDAEQYNNLIKNRPRVEPISRQSNGYYYEIINTVATVIRRIFWWHN